MRTSAHGVMQGIRAAVRLNRAMSILDVIQQLPEVSRVRDLSKALAMLDAVMSPEWEARYYSFDSHWSPDDSGHEKLPTDGHEAARWRT